MDESTIAKILHKIDLLEKYGTSLGMPHVKKITTSLYELRIRGKQETRIFYGFIKNKQSFSSSKQSFSTNKIYLVHAFKKQTQKTPKKEIKIATERLKILLDMI